jgi:hypothetical protein
MKKHNKERTPMEELTKGYEAFIKGKKVNAKGKKLFNKVIKKAVKPPAAK